MRTSRFGLLFAFALLQGGVECGHLLVVALLPTLHRKQTGLEHTFDIRKTPGRYLRLGETYAPLRLERRPGHSMTELALDRRNDDLRVGQHVGREPVDHISLAVDQEFLEVPEDLLRAARVDAVPDEFLAKVAAG